MGTGGLAWPWGLEGWPWGLEAWPWGLEGWPGHGDWRAGLAMGTGGLAMGTGGLVIHRRTPLRMLQYCVEKTFHVIFAWHSISSPFPPSLPPSLPTGF